MDMNMPTQEDAVRFYYGLPGELLYYKYRLRWILSKDTMESLAGHELKDEDMTNETMPPALMGIPILRNDDMNGLHIEVIP